MRFTILLLEIYFNLFNLHICVPQNLFLFVYLKNLYLELTVLIFYG